MKRAAFPLVLGGIGPAEAVFEAEGGDGVAHGVGAVTGADDGRRLKWLPICDEFSRELVALEVARRMEAKDVIRILNEAVIARGCVPEYIRSDNGPEFVALAVQERIARNGFRTLYIKPGAPWQNAYSERLPAPSGAALRAVFGRLSRSARINSRFRDEFLNRETFASVLEAKVLGKQHRQRHNQERPHSSLDYQTPVEFAQRSLAAALFPQDTNPTKTKPENNEKLS